MGAGSGREVPEGTQVVARAAFPKGCLAMRVRDALGPLFDDEVFRSAFGVRGRPGVAPGQLAWVSVLQFAENLTDRQAAHAVRARIDWTYLLGLVQADSGYDFTVLTGLRDRLLAHCSRGNANPHGCVMTTWVWRAAPASVAYVVRSGDPAWFWPQH